MQNGGDSSSQAALPRSAGRNPPPSGRRRASEMPHVKSSPLLAATLSKQTGGAPKPLERGGAPKQEKAALSGGKNRVKFAPNASC
jgi:hypothetical protein